MQTSMESSYIIVEYVVHETVRIHTDFSQQNYLHLWKLSYLFYILFFAWKYS